MSEQEMKTGFTKVVEEAFNKGNFEVLPEVFNPDFIEHQFGLHPTIPGIQKDITFLRTSFPDFNLTIDEIVVVGDKLWARMTGRGTNKVGFMGPPNGKSFAVTVFDEVRFENGKIVEHWGVPDRFAQMAQLEILPRAGAKTPA